MVICWIWIGARQAIFITKWYLKNCPNLDRFTWSFERYNFSNLTLFFRFSEFTSCKINILILKTIRLDVQRTQSWDDDRHQVFSRRAVRRYNSRHYTTNLSPFSFFYLSCRVQYLHGDHFVVQRRHMLVGTFCKVGKKSVNK